MRESYNPELVDLVDANGFIQKVGVPREQVDNFPELFMPIVIGVLYNLSGEVLVHRRALAKRVNPGDIDHVCGGIMSGETPEDALIRESQEETGLTPTNIVMIDRGINVYRRYRYLYAGRVEGDPMPNPIDSEWVRFMNASALQQAQESGEMTFVDEFFTDMELASQQ